MRPYNQLMSRRRFESLIAGTWTRHDGDRYRSNGAFRTRLRRVRRSGRWVTVKEVSDGTNTLWASTWAELADILNLRPPDVKEHGQVTRNDDDE